MDLGSWLQPSSVYNTAPKHVCLLCLLTYLTTTWLRVSGFVNGSVSTYFSRLNRQPYKKNLTGALSAPSAMEDPSE